MFNFAIIISMLVIKQLESYNDVYNIIKFSNILSSLIDKTKKLKNPKKLLHPYRYVKYNKTILVPIHLKYDKDIYNFVKKITPINTTYAEIDILCFELFLIVNK